jgi:phosphate starvation-inducible protein PhoH
VSKMDNKSRVIVEEEDNENELEQLLYSLSPMQKELFRGSFRDSVDYLVSMDFESFRARVVNSIPDRELATRTQEEIQTREKIMDEILKVGSREIRKRYSKERSKKRKRGEDTTTDDGTHGTHGTHLEREGEGKGGDKPREIYPQKYTAGVSNDSSLLCEAVIVDGKPYFAVSKSTTAEKKSITKNIFQN